MACVLQLVLSKVKDQMSETSRNDEYVALNVYGLQRAKRVGPLHTTCASSVRFKFKLKNGNSA